MIQDLGDKRLDNRYFDRKPKKADAVLSYRWRTVCLSGDEDFPTFGFLAAHVRELNLPLPSLRYLFSIDGRGYYLTDLGETEPPGFAYFKIFDLRQVKSPEVILAGATGWHLHSWYRANRFCGVCGGALAHCESERAMHCVACGNLVYPRISPAVIVGVTDGSRILMTKYKGREYKNYALIAGFAEIGEAIEETVRREVLEEVGLKVDTVRYYKSQPWGFDGLLLMGFFAEAEKPLLDIIMDAEELAVAEWVEGAQIAYERAPISLTGEMMQAFRAQITGEPM